MRIVLALCLTLAPAAVLAEDAASVIARLGDDDPAVRDAAQRALVEAGEAALPAVRASLADGGPRDAEARARLQEIAETLMWRKAYSDAPEALLMVTPGLDSTDGFQEIGSSLLETVFVAGTRVFLVTHACGKSQVALLGPDPGASVAIAADLTNLLDLVPFLRPARTDAELKRTVLALAGLAVDPAGRGARSDGVAYHLVDADETSQRAVRLFGKLEWEIFFSADGVITAIQPRDGC